MQNMKNLGLLLTAICCLMVGCKKDNVITTQPATTGETKPAADIVTTDSTPASALKGVNWAADGDNFSDGILVLSGLASTDSYATVSSKADAVLTGIQNNTGANTLRLPVNYSTVSQTWWNSYTGVIDKALSKGMNVILGYWEGNSSKDGKIDNTTEFWSMWQTIVNKYGSNTHVYFEIFNEPHGYTLSEWTTICAQWLSNYPTVPQGRILISGTSYSQDITGVGADSRFSGCLLSIHDYTFFSNGTLTTALQWENRFKANIGAYSSRAVLTEFGIPMTGGKNYTGAINADQEIAYLQGLTNQVRAYTMGAVYWPGIRTGDSYAIQQLNGTAPNYTVSTTNASGLSRIKYAWGVGAGGTDTFYTGAYYRFLNLNSGQALDVNGASTANGTGIIQWPQNGGNNQQWIITDNGGGYYKITNRNSGQALDVNMSSTANGAGIIQYPWNGGNNQQWQLTGTGTGIYKVINRNSGKALDVNGASTANGANIIQYAYSGGNNQQWQIVQQ
ncbi:ricin-type beta-trefoil lectin protein [Mucilaginibacter oryzae]|uniref:Ricin-type beta-trefoil lectin protein n=1 Tax=Mucilaginibacter oryzae TaxID=468058 RepID=A0A316HTY0_9SPHI|nr:RICIN domain-containing protein [Mucilaginibacter oryzae]PWK78422.1 ricin-type beta-trefoil lectin protein [Mucilaginibacter oryzae]